MANYKNNTNAMLHEYYNKRGLKETIEVATKMLELKNHKEDKVFYSQVHGEICETICELCILDFMNSNPKATKDWILKKGLILKDPDGKDTYMTELDLTLFTPFKIFTIECKSYRGHKTFTDRCTVKRKNIHPTDVYAQHEKHYKTLLSNFEGFRVIEKNTVNIAPMLIGYFDFSIGTVKDERSDTWKELMPILNVNNINAYLKYLTNPLVCWKMSYVKRAVDIIGKKTNQNTKRHLDYVKSLHPR